MIALALFISSSFVRWLQSELSMVLIKNKTKRAFVACVDGMNYINNVCSSKNVYDIEMTNINAHKT